MAAPPIPEAAVARQAATRKPTTRRRSPNVKGWPNHRSEQPGHQKGLAGIPGAIEYRGEKTSVTQKAGSDGADYHPNDERQTARGPNVIKSLRRGLTRARIRQRPSVPRAKLAPDGLPGDTRSRSPPPRQTRAAHPQLQL